MSFLNKKLISFSLKKKLGSYRCIQCKKKLPRSSRHEAASFVLKFTISRQTLFFEYEQSFLIKKFFYEQGSYQKKTTFLH
jgi:hypothetical protein